MIPREKVSRGCSRPAAFFLASITGLLAASAGESEDAQGGLAGDKPRQVHWQYFQPIALPAETAGPLADVTLGPEAFTNARHDLADLRLYDKTGAIVPYALRVLRTERQRHPFPAKEFNRAQGP